MAKNNIKLLTHEQLRQFNTKYTILLEDDKICVKTVNYAKITRHDSDKPFHINAKNIRKIQFSVDAINIWKKFCLSYKDNVFTLFDVQQAVNKLIVMYQKPTFENVKQLLERDTTKIKRIF